MYLHVSLFCSLVTPCLVCMIMFMRSHLFMLTAGYLLCHCRGRAASCACPIISHLISYISYAMLENIILLEI